MITFTPPIKKNKSHKKIKDTDYVVSVHKNTVLYYKTVNDNNSHKKRVDQSIIPEIVLPEDYE